MENLREEAKQKYAIKQKELELIPTYEEIDYVFFITDSFKHERFVSDRVLFTISRRIIDTYQSWNGYIHRLLVPNPGHLPEPQESQTLTEEKRKQLQTLLRQIMSITSKNALTILELTEPVEVINEGVRFWNEDFVPTMQPIIGDIVTMWNKNPEETKKPKHAYNGVS
jgi:hypothetical protein